MRKSNILTFAIAAMTLGCANPNAEYIEKINKQVKEDAMGVELNYENIQFQWTDTLRVGEKLASLDEQFNERLKSIMEIEFYVKDNFEKGKIFTKDYLTKDRFTELRNWELTVRNSNENSYDGQGSLGSDNHKDYFEYAFANREASSWLSELCNQIEETDSLLTIYDELEDGNLGMIQNALWFYKRIESYHTDLKPSDLWDKVGTELTELKELKTEIDSLTSLDPLQVIHYKALNTYKINNPELNGAEQELKRYFIFNAQYKIIGKEDAEK
jgi:hypothetical protein